MTKKEIRLKGFVYYDIKDDKFYAFCIDLNLADQGNSLNEVLDKLHENMLQYITTELKYYRENDIEGFPFRKAPLNIRLLYLRAYVVSTLTHSYRIFKGLFDVDNNELDLCAA